MGTISLIKVNRLYWLGRYSERVFTTLDILGKYCDKMVDKDPEIYIDFCNKLGITNHFIDKNDFIKKYLSDSENVFSIMGALKEAYNNAVVLRDEIQSRTLSFIQLAINNLNNCIDNDCRFLDFQSITDNLLSFWGSVDDYIINESVRGIIKAGKYIERNDLYERFAYPQEIRTNETKRLIKYVHLLPSNFLSESVIKELKESKRKKGLDQ